jgi:hypothetical protein
MKKEHTKNNTSQTKKQRTYFYGQRGPCAHDKACTKCYCADESLFLSVVIVFRNAFLLSIHWFKLVITVQYVYLAWAQVNQTLSLKTQIRLDGISQIPHFLHQNLYLALALAWYHLNIQGLLRR